MAASYCNVSESGLLSQQYPPALLPKPGKENARLQKLLKKTEKKTKKKAAPETAKTPVPFRSNLSPVNEASPDLEHSDHSTPPKTPETPFYTLHPRFVVRPVYRHVTSPYPQHRGETSGGIARFSPQLYAPPAPSFPQHVAPLYTFTPSLPPPVPGPMSDAVAPTWPVPTSSVPELITTAAVQTAPLVPAPVTPAATQSTLRLAPVLIPRKSPSPRFKATEATLKAPRPMFDVPQIWVYTASKSPLHDYTGKTSTAGPIPWIKSTIPEIRIATTPTAEIKTSGTPTFEVKSSFTSTSEIKRGAEFEIYQDTIQTSEVIRSTTQIPENNRSPTPTSAVKRGLASAPEIQRSLTPTSEVKRAKMPVHEFLTPRTNMGRPKTPSYHVTRAITPVFEISRPNPLLFAVSPITTETQRSTPTLGSNTDSISLSASQYLTASETEPLKSLSTISTTQNGEVMAKETATTKLCSENISKPEAPQQEPPVVESNRPKNPTTQLGNERPKTPTVVTSKSTAALCQMPKIPSAEELKPLISAVGYQRPQPPAGYQRPKTPIAGVSPRFQRPKTPTYVAPIPAHTYYGLTPAEYVAHGGIQSFLPSFSISRSKTPTLIDFKIPAQGLEVSQKPTQELLVKTQDLPTLLNQEASSKELKQISSIESIVSMTADVQLPLPTIFVTQAEDISEPSVSTAVTSRITTTVEETPKVKTMAYPRPWSKSPIPEVKNQEVEILVKTETNRVSPKPTLETQHPKPAVAIIDAIKSTPLLPKTESPVAEVSVAQQKELKESTDLKTPTKIISEAETAVTKPNNSFPVAQTAPEKTVGAVLAKPKDNQEAKLEKSVLTSTTQLTDNKNDSLPAAEPLLKVIQKPKGMMKSKLSGWSRLKKHMVVEEEPPLSQESDSKKETSKETEQEGGEAKKDEKVSLKDMVSVAKVDDLPKTANKWDSLLYDMFSSKEKIMQVIEASKSEEEKKVEPKNTQKEIPSFAYRLPVLLFSPKFDAKRLKEAASRPLTKISTVFEMGLIGRKNKDEEPKDFNRTARGFTCP
uniref:Proline rich 33 n=1 Tax=Esox lucius TaxID=8010 RepID=A0A3P8XM48_ESOLU